MSFWKFNFKQTSAIDTLLEKEDTTLTQILDEDDVIQECKVQNKRLINFVVQPANLEELVKMVCQEPPDAKDERSRFKYPHLACEILTSETKDASFTILEQLCCDDRYQGMLWSFLDEKEPLNPLTGSFISKVLSVLLAHKCHSVVQFILSKENFIPSFLSHLNTSAFSDLLLQMFAAPDTDQARLDLALWLNDNAVVELLVDKIHVGEDDDLCVNVAQLLGDIVRIGREWHQMSLPSPIIARLEEKETVERLLKNMLDTPEKSDVVIVSGISVLLSLMETRRQPNPFEPQTPVEEYTAGLLCALGPLTERVGVVRDLLERPPKAGSQMVNTTGMLDPPLGSTRLQVLKLFVAMISAGSADLNERVIQHDVFNTVLDLFFMFPWNNFLHLQVEQCLHVILDIEVHTTLQPLPPRQPPVSNNQSLHEYLFGQCRMLERLLEGYNINENIVASGGRRQGYMGHLTHMVNSIRKWYESAPALKELVQTSTGEAVWSRWCDFLVGPLVEVNRRNEMTIGGETNTSSFDDGDDDFESPAFGSGNMLEKEFADYRNILLATPIEDDFGSDILDTHEEPLTSLFNRPTAIMLETLADESKSDLMTHYESACTAHIQQFDESHSDGEEEEGEGLDPWPESNVGLNSTLDRNSSGVVFSSSEDDDDDSPFDGLHTQRGLKLSHRDSDEEDDKEGIEPRGTVHFTSPSSLNERAAAYVSDSLGADSTTHQDLSNAGLDEFLHWRGDLQLGDSDSGSDDDTRAVVGLSAQLDWTKEADPEHKAEQHVEPAPTEGFIDEVELVSAAKGGSGSESRHKEEAQDVDLASSDVKLLLNDSTEEEDTPVLPQEKEATGQEEPAASSAVSEGGLKESQTPTSSTLDVEEGKRKQEEPEVSPSSSQLDQKQEAAQEADSTSTSAQEVSIANHKQEVMSLPSEVREVTSSSSKVPEAMSSGESEVQEVTLSLDGDSHLANDVDQPEDNSQDHTHISNDRGVPAGEVGASNRLPNDSHEEGTPVDAEEPVVTSKTTESHSEPPMVNGPLSGMLDIGGGITLDLDDMEDMELDEDIDDLDDNFSFLAKGLLSGKGSVGMRDEEQQPDQSPERLEMIERIRQEAQIACYQYEFETKANTK